MESQSYRTVSVLISAGETFYQQNYANMFREGADGAINRQVTIDGVNMVFLKTLNGRIVVDNVHII